MTEEMTKDVMISISGLQEYEDMDDDSIELTTAGKLTRTNEGGYHLSYQESALTGMEGTLTTFEILPRRVVLTRTGQVCSEMVFETGVRHLSLYDTPYGHLEIGVAARAVRSTIGDKGGELEISYAVDVDHRLTGENTVYLTVKEAKISQ
jgi:uncharacterized beta-barrel protein YwiB (DUF1934 family)